MIHVLRGHPSKRKLATEERKIQILSQAIYQGFGPTPPDECLKLGLHGPNELLKFVLEHKSEV